ncbi:MAG: glycosyltransferase family 4 protein [Gammaproteobacteria bacterium]|nr:glycosyltransferase family 4 protein [Gammaproteobacteria bacterium]
MTNNPKIRLAIVVTHPIQYLAPLYRELAKQMEVEVLFCHRQNAKGQADAGFGVEFEWDVPLTNGYQYRWLKNISKRPGLGHFFGTNAPELADLLSSGCYDAVWVNGWNHKCYIQALWHGRRNGLPVLCRGDSQLGMTKGFWKRCLKRAIYPFLLRSYSAHLCVGTRNRRYLRHFGVPEKKLFKMSHFIDTEFFARMAAKARSTKERQILRKEWGFTDNTFIFLFVGKFISKKRPIDLLEAFIKLGAKDYGKEIGLLFVGDGPLRHALEQMASKVDNKVAFAGFRNQSELPACYVTADAIVLPSEASETWGLVVNEAMACGIPAIVSNAVGCAPDMVEEGVTGFSYPLGDVRSLEKAMKDSINMSAEKDSVDPLRKVTSECSVSEAAESLRRALDKI